MRRILAAGLACLTALATTPAMANDQAICFNNGSANDAGIAACSRLIADGKYKGQNLARAYSWRAVFLSRKGDLERAISDTDARLRLTPADASAFRDRAIFWVMKRDYDRAVRDADDAIRLNPKDAQIYNARGFAKQLKQDYDGAIADYDQAIKMGTRLAVIYSNRGTAWQLKGDGVRALADQDKAVALDPKNAGVLFNRAVVLRSNGQIDKALADLDRAAVLNPKLGEIQAERGLIFRALNDLPRAVAAYDRALQLDPKSIGAYTSRGLAHEAIGDTARAERDFKAALDIAGGRVMDVGRDTTLIEVGGHRDHDVARARLAVLAAADTPVAKPQSPAATSDGGRRVALVIGNGAYRSAGALANPASDAAAIAKTLRNMGFEVSEGIDLDHVRMTRQIADFLRGAATARVAVLFYAGHGIQIDGKNYLLPVDARIENGAELTADMTDLDTILAGLDDQVRTNIVILDACRDNPAKSVTQIAGASRSVTVRSGLAAPSGIGKGATSGAGTLLAFATAPGQIALDGDGANSPFSTALVRHIATPGLEVQQMLTRVRAEVVAATRSKQVPWSNSSLLGEVYLVGARP